MRINKTFTHQRTLLHGALEGDTLSPPSLECIEWLPHTNTYDHWKRSSSAQIYCAFPSLSELKVHFHPVFTMSAIGIGRQQHVDATDECDTDRLGDVEAQGSLGQLLYCSPLIDDLSSPVPGLAGFTDKVTQLLWQLCAQLIHTDCTRLRKDNTRNTKSRQSMTTSKAVLIWERLLLQLRRAQSTTRTATIICYGVEKLNGEDVAEFSRAARQLRSSMRIIFFAEESEASTAAKRFKAGFTIVTARTEYEGKALLEVCDPQHWLTSKIA